MNYFTQIDINAQVISDQADELTTAASQILKLLTDLQQQEAITTRELRDLQAEAIKREYHTIQDPTGAAYRQGVQHATDIALAGLAAINRIAYTLTAP